MCNCVISPRDDAGKSYLGMNEGDLLSCPGARGSALRGWFRLRSPRVFTWMVLARCDTHEQLESGLVLARESGARIVGNDHLLGADYAKGRQWTGDKQPALTTTGTMCGGSGCDRTAFEQYCGLCPMHWLGLEPAERSILLGQEPLVIHHTTTERIRPTRERVAHGAWTAYAVLSLWLWTNVGLEQAHWLWRLVTHLVGK